MSEFILVVVLANLIMLVCMYVLRHVIAIRAPVLFIAVGISILLCVLYPYLAARVPYPMVLYLYVVLILAGAGLLYRIENRYFAAKIDSRDDMAGIAVGDGLAAIGGGPVLNVDRGVFQGFGELPEVMPEVFPGKKTPTLEDEPGEPTPVAMPEIAAEVPACVPAVELPEAAEELPVEAFNRAAPEEEAADSFDYRDAGDEEAASAEDNSCDIAAGETDDEPVSMDWPDSPVEAAAVEDEPGEPAPVAMPEIAAEVPACAPAVEELPEVAEELLVEAFDGAAPEEEAVDSFDYGDAGVEGEAPAGVSVEETRPAEDGSSDDAVGETCDEPVSMGWPEEISADTCIDMEPVEFPVETKDIGILVARAFDRLGAGDRAGAAEVFYKALRLNPPPRLAAMLCIEISSIYMAEGRKGQALAVMEMLQDVFGADLDESDSGRIKTIIIQLRREVQ